MSSDAFGLFEEHDLNDKRKIREVGMKFRSSVLSLGGGTPPSSHEGMTNRKKGRKGRRTVCFFMFNTHLHQVYTA